MNVADAVFDARTRFLSLLEESWEPVSRFALGCLIAFFALLLLAATASPGSGPLAWFDLVFVPVHEGGHLLFGWFGSKWLMVAGGILLQLGVPLALAVYFAFHRQIPGTAFCTFFFFEQFLPIATYMADARSQSLAYVTVGDPELAEHDWFYLFSQAGVLEHDTQIAGFVRVLGWLGMLAVVAWLIWRERLRNAAP